MKSNHETVVVVGTPEKINAEKEGQTRLERENKQIWRANKQMVVKWANRGKMGKPWANGQTMGKWANRG